MIAFWLFVLIIVVFFPVKSLRALSMRKRLLAAEELSQVKRKGILERFTPYVISFFTAVNVHISYEKRELIQSRLIRAGYEEKMSVDHFITFRVLSGIGTALYFLFLGLISENLLLIFLTFAGPVIGYKIPDIWLKQRIRLRQEKIRRELPYVLNSISILCDAGMNLFAAIKEVVETKEGELATELKEVMKSFGMGTSQQEALEQMTLRCQVDEVSRFVSALSQTLARGSSGVTAVLRQQAAEVWETRKKQAQQLGEQASMKLFFPLVLLAFPAMAIFILGPVAINLFQFFTE